MNTFGIRFKFTTFGESHGKAIGVVVDGVPAGLAIDESFIQRELNRRRPGQNEFATKRKEDDKVEILSGVFEGISTGTPIGMVIYNKDQKSKDYSKIKDIFRPAHADYTYWHKYGIRDYRGGGRSSARETAARVAAGAIAKLLLKEIGIELFGGLFKVGELEIKDFDFEYARRSDIFALDKEMEKKIKEKIKETKKSGDSLGGGVVVVAKGVPVGLGEPIYYKLDAILASAIMSINGVKAVEIGEGSNVANLKGSQNNDEISSNGFLSNRSGGILGGISNSQDIVVKCYFKPTPSIYKEQKTINIKNEDVNFKIEGRHDPIIAVRGVVVAEAMMALVLADMVLLNLSSKMDYLKRIYKEGRD